MKRRRRKKKNQSEAKKEEFQKEPKKTFVLKEKIFFRKEKKPWFSPNNLTRWKEWETFLGWIFKKKKLKKIKQATKKEKWMIEKEWEVEKPIISGHLFLNKGDKKTAKSDSTMGGWAWCYSRLSTLWRTWYDDSLWSVQETIWWNWEEEARQTAWGRGSKNSWTSVRNCAWDGCKASTGATSDGWSFKFFWTSGTCPGGGTDGKSQFAWSKDGWIVW